MVQEFIMKKIWIVVALVVVIAAFIIVNLAKREKGIEVLAEKVKRGTVQEKVTGSGQIKPAVEVKVSAQVAGKIIRINAKEGDHVKKGQLLVALDPRQYQASRDRSKSSLLAAVANEKKAKSDLVRSKELYAKKLISEADYETTEANYQAAVGSRMQAEAALKEAEDALRKTQLYATMDGIVTRVNKEVGEMAIGAQFQEDVIMIVSDLSKMEAVIEVDESDVVSIHLGDSAQVEIDAFPDTSFWGTVTEIANSAITKGLGTQEQVTNFEVTVTLIDQDSRFRPGMSTTVDILTRKMKDVIKVPIQAVTVREKQKLKRKKGVEEHEEAVAETDESKKMQEVVFVIEDRHAIAKPVKLGISDDTHYAVLNGLNEGDMVITGPFKILNKTLKNDALVTIKKSKKKR